MRIDPPGVTDKEILIGSSLALGGHAAYLGLQTLHGAMAYFHDLNQHGGIFGRSIRLIAEDDEYDPPRCIANTQKLIVEDQVFALFGYVGTPTTLNIVPLVEEAKIPLVGMFTGAHALREPVNRYLINVRASYYQETDAIVHYLVKTKQKKRIAVFYQYDSYGFDGLRGTELALKKFGLVPVGKGSYIRGTLNVEQGLSKIITSKADAVVMIGTYAPCAKFIHLCRKIDFDGIFCNVSFVGADALAKRLGPDGEGVIVTQVVPPPDLLETQKRLWGVRDYISLTQRIFPKDEPNSVGLEGFINARVFAEGLRRVGRSLDRESFINALETIKLFDLGIDNELTFSPEDHQGLERVYFTRIENGKFVLIAE